MAQWRRALRGAAPDPCADVSGVGNDAGEDDCDIGGLMMDLTGLMMDDGIIRIG